MCDHCVTGDLPAFWAVVFFIFATVVLVGSILWDTGWRPRLPWRR